MGNKFDEFMERFSKHPVINAIVLLVTPVIIIHLLYTLPHIFGSLKILKNCDFFKSYFFKAKIPAGNLLAYIGTILTFSVTFMLSLLVYRSNIEERKRSRLLEEKALLVENRTLLSIDKKQIIKVDYLDVDKEKPYDVFWNVDFEVISAGVIEKVFQKNISIDDYTIKRDRKAYSSEYAKKNELNFQYLPGGNISVSFAITDKENKAFNLMKCSNYFSIGADFEFVCDTVKTPISIIIILKEIDKKLKDEPLSRIYEIENAFIHHRKAEFVE